MWYYARNNQRMGPVSFVELQRLAASGGLQSNDMVLEAGKDRWLGASTVQGLFRAVSSVSPNIHPVQQQPRHENLSSSPREADPMRPQQDAVGLRTWWERIRLHLRRAIAWDLRRVPVDSDEQKHFTDQGVSHPILQGYLAWRRSVLLVMSVPAALIALLATADNLGADYRLLSGFGRLWVALQILAPYAMPVAVVGATLAGTNRRLSGKIMAYGWAVSFLGPILLYLVPAHWLYDFRHANPDAQQYAELGARFGFGIGVFLLLCVSLPIYVVSMSFGVQRACLRLKTLIPESAVPGLFLVAAAPVLSVALLPFFVLTNQLASSPLLILGMLSLMCSPLVYIVRARVFIRPLMGEGDLQQMRRVQWVAQGMFWLGVILLLVYAMTRVWLVPRLGGEMDDLAHALNRKTLLGFSRDTSLFRPWDWRIIRWLAIETLGRSLFTTILVADLFMRVNQSVWRYSRQLAEGSKSAGYDSLMLLLDGAIRSNPNTPDRKS